MKVLHVIPSIGPLRGGPSVTVRTITEALVRQGVEAHVATTDDNHIHRLAVPHGRPILEAGVTYWYFPRQTRFYNFSWPLYRWLSENVHTYDLVHLHGLFSFASTAGSLLFRRRGIPWVIQPHGILNQWGIKNRRPFLKRWSLRLIEGPALRQADLVLYNSEQERTEALCVTLLERSCVIPSPVPDANQAVRSSPENLPSKYPELRGKSVILFLSRLDEKKGLDLLFHAFAGICAIRSDVALLVAGDGDPKFVAALRQVASELQIARNLIWTGFLEGRDKAVAFAGARVFVLPSYSESFGIAAVEAMGAGLPVVVSDQVPIHQEIEHSGAGLAVPCDPDALRRALVRVIDDSRLQLSAAAKARSFSEQFAPEVIAKRVLEKYETLIGLRTNVSASVRSATIV